MMLPALILLTLLSSPAPDWVVVGSHREAIMAFDRASVVRERDRASVTVLMGLFKPEVAGSPPALVQYYLSDETFDCQGQSRVEHEVRVYASSGELMGISPPDPEPEVRPGSIYHDVVRAACSPEEASAGERYVTPMEAIRGETDRRRAKNLEVVN